MVEGGRGIDNAGSGEKGTDMVECGVECEEEEVGEGVVRVSDGVRARTRGLRKDTLRSLSKGDGCNHHEMRIGDNVTASSPASLSGD